MVVVKDMAVVKDMGKATITATRDMAIVGTDDPPEILRPTTQRLLLIILLRPTTLLLLLITLLRAIMPTPMQRIYIINQFLVMVLKRIGHLPVTSLSDTPHPDVTDRCGMANSRVMEDIMFVNL